MESTKDIAEVYERKGKIQVILGNYIEAVQLFEKSKQIYLEIDNQASIATIDSHLGETKWLLGHIEEAKEYLEQSLRFRNEINNIQLIADSKIRLGKLYSSLGEFEIAKNHLNEGLKLQQIYDNKIEIADSIYCLANYIQPINLDELINYQNQLQLLSQSNSSKRISNIMSFIDLIILSQESTVETNLESLQIELEDYLQSNDLAFEIRLNAMILLSRTLITLFSTNLNLKTLKSLSEIIEDLISFADEQNSHIVSLQARLLNVKLSIVDFKLKHAENLILEGQKIAEDMQLNYILNQFRDEHIFINQIKFKWEKRDKNSIGLEERLTESKIIQVISEKSGSWGAIPNFYSK